MAGSMFEWIDPFAKIAEAERAADRAHDNALDAQEYAERIIQGERRAASYEIGHLRAVNAWMMEQLISLSSVPQISLVLPSAVDLNLRAEDTHMETATEIATHLESRGAYIHLKPEPKS